MWDYGYDFVDFKQKKEALYRSEFDLDFKDIKLRINSHLSLAWRAIDEFKMLFSSSGNSIDSSDMKTLGWTCNSFEGMDIELYFIEIKPFIDSAICSLCYEYMKDDKFKLLRGLKGCLNGFLSGASNKCDDETKQKLQQHVVACMKELDIAIALGLLLKAEYSIQNDIAAEISEQELEADPPYETEH